MNRTALILILTLMCTFISCTHSPDASYDEGLCRDLSIKIEQRDSLTSRDYSLMITQDEAILKYLVDRSREIADLPDSIRTREWRSMTADPEYLERFGYMFTLGSALYNAELNGRLDERNAANFAALDRYNEELAQYADRF